jgi:uncharacterized protein (TIGR02996 family)
MTDHDALLGAVCAFPDDDTPRLIYADFVEEHGDGRRAAFIRAQVKAARMPLWEPFAVYCRYRKPEWNEFGRPFRASLPELPAPDLGWGFMAFRRGFGWRVLVQSLLAWNRIASDLLECAPVGELDLNPPSIRDDWRAFARGDWVRRLRVVHLDGPSPVEPIRALCESPHAAGITDIHFNRASSPGLPELIDDLLQTPLGRGLKGLHFRVGYESLDHLIQALCSATSTILDRLSFQTMGITPLHLARLFQSRLTSQLQELQIRDERLDQDPNEVFFEWLERLPPTLLSLRLPKTELNGERIRMLRSSGLLARVKALDLSQNAAAGSLPDLFAGSGNVRSLDLIGNRVAPELLLGLTQSPGWHGLVRLNLRNNHLPRAVVRPLMNAPIPKDLTALLIDASTDGDIQSTLKRRFGKRLITA